MLDEYCEHTLVHTGQNYDDRLSGLFFRFYGEMLPAAVVSRLSSYSHIMVESGIAAIFSNEAFALSET
mgnify:CR=1 FL=1